MIILLDSKILTKSHSLMHLKVRIRCRSLAKKIIEVEVVTYPAAKTTIPRPFHNSMIEAFGFSGQPFKRSRTKLKLYALVFVCILTGATNILVLKV